MLEGDILAERLCTALASVSMVVYLYVLSRPAIDRHVPEPNAGSSADMDKASTVRASFLRCTPPAFQMEHQPAPVSYYFGTDVFIALKRWVVCYNLFYEHVSVPFLLWLTKL